MLFSTDDATVASSKVVKRVYVADGEGSSSFEMLAQDMAIDFNANRQVVAVRGGLIPEFAPRSTPACDSCGKCSEHLIAAQTIAKARTQCGLVGHCGDMVGYMCMHMRQSCRDCATLSSAMRNRRRRR